MINKASTSIHSLNADRGLSKPKKVVYLFLNWVNNLFPYVNVDPRILFKAPDPESWKTVWDKDSQVSSAPRKFSDMYWRTLPWGGIKKELGEIHLFDTGCGSGGYGVRIDEAAGSVASYTGIDAKEKSNWNELMKTRSNFKLIKSNSNTILDLIPEHTNLFITQSAIEHFDQDLRFFEQIRTFIENHPDRTIMQIHVFPAAATLPLYLFHGLRQYTPRTVSSITRLFDQSTDISLTGLGGRQSKKLHFTYFTWPILYLRKKGKWEEDPLLYGKNLYSAIKSDMNTSDRSPLFWALMIRSQARK